MKFDLEPIKVAAEALFAEGGDLTKEITALLKAILAVVFGVVEKEI